MDLMDYGNIDQFHAHHRLGEEGLVTKAAYDGASGSSQTMTLLYPKSTSLLGTWNVRAMFQPGLDTIIGEGVWSLKCGSGATPGTRQEVCRGQKPMVN